MRERKTKRKKPVTAREQKGKLKLAFLGNVNHRISSPLTLILRNVDQLRERVPDADSETQRSVKAIADAAIQLERALHAIVDILRIETGNFSISPTRLELDRIIERAIAEFEELAKRKGLRLIYERQMATAAATCDQYCLTQALAILLDNALKYTDKGHVLVRVSVRQNRTVQIEVEDTGRGMDLTDSPVLFQPFPRRAAQPQESNLGLGLALAQRYLALNGAQLSVRSGKSRGTIFTIHLRDRIA
jgi:signal transduction histidine kinase